MVGIFLVISAFKDSTLQGLLSLLLPLCLAYWAFARFEHPRRRALLWTFFGAPLLAAAIWGVWLFATLGSHVG